jgi:hypothetical protein
MEVFIEKYSKDDLQGSQAHGWAHVSCLGLANTAEPGGNAGNFIGEHMLVPHVADGPRDWS